MTTPRSLYSLAVFLFSAVAVGSGPTYASFPVIMMTTEIRADTFLFNAAAYLSRSCLLNTLVVSLYTLLTEAASLTVLHLHVATILSCRVLLAALWLVCYLRYTLEESQLGFRIVPETFNETVQERRFVPVFPELPPHDATVFVLTTVFVNYVLLPLYLWSQRTRERNARGEAGVRP